MKPEDGARKQIEIYRKMTGKQRLRIAMELYELSRELISANIRKMYPNISKEKFHRVLMWRMHELPEKIDRRAESLKRH